MGVELIDGFEDYFGKAHDYLNARNKVLSSWVVVIVVGCVLPKCQSNDEES